MELSGLLDPFELSGPQFLKFYAMLAVVCFLLTWGIRYVSRYSLVAESSLNRPLTPFEVACLSNGKTAVFSISLILLLRNQIVQFNEEVKSFTVVRGISKTTHRIIQALFNRIRQFQGALWGSIAGATDGESEKIILQLRSNGFLLFPFQAAVVRYAPAVVCALLILVGGVRIYSGFTRGRPVAFLVLMVIAVALLFTRFFKESSRLTRKGEKYLEDLKQRNSKLSSISALRSNTLSDSDLALAVGLFGLGSIEMEMRWWTSVQATLAPKREGKGGWFSGFLGSRSYGDSGSYWSSSFFPGGCSCGGCGGGGCGGGGGGCGGCGGG